MSTLRNSVRLIGRLGRDPEFKEFESGKKMVNFSLATSDVYYDDQGNRVEQTQWHYVLAWGKLAETVEKFVRKGQEIAVEGKLVYRDYETKEGVKKSTTEVVLSELVLLGGKEKS
ncbi:single-stranded DNA-binding protein [Flavobacterium sp. JP2137]|uniref:single-stranded DNA-binding protein n=1 Tax=Flavobacterium sp. JP2137 TaxID=3414510 RepID=UPI003D2FF343